MTSMRYNPWKPISSLDTPERLLQGREEQHSPHSPTHDQLRWSWSYSSSQPGTGGSSIKARGKLITDNDSDGDGVYQVLGISGQRNGVRITGLVPAGTFIPGNVDPVTGNGYVVDNQIRPQSKGRPDGQLDSKGIGYALSDGSYCNIFYASFLSPAIYLDFHAQPPFPNGLIAPNTETAVQFRADMIGCHF